MKKVLVAGLKMLAGAAWTAVKAVSWKPVLYKIYWGSVKPELERLVKDSESKWDDSALLAVSFVIEKFLGSNPANVDSAKLELAATLPEKPSA